MLCGAGLQTAQRKIREIIHQVKQQQQKNQQGAATPSQHTKWPAGGSQQAATAAYECSSSERQPNWAKRRKNAGKKNKREGNTREGQATRSKPKNLIRPERASLWEQKSTLGALQTSRRARQQVTDVSEWDRAEMLCNGTLGWICPLRKPR